jgi:hypothetical protein
MLNELGIRVAVSAEMRNWIRGSKPRWITITAGASCPATVWPISISLERTISRDVESRTPRHLPCGDRGANIAVLRFDKRYFDIDSGLAGYPLNYASAREIPSPEDESNSVERQQRGKVSGDVMQMRSRLY